MKTSSVFGIISDIHGNEEALKAVLECGRANGVDDFICLGDVIGYGASVNECIELVRENCSLVVQGNHDGEIMPPRNVLMVPEAQIALDYALRVLSKESVDWLLSLKHPVEKVEGHFLAVHGSIEGRDNYIFSNKDVEANFRLLKQYFPEDNLVFFGHTHLPMVLGERKAVTEVKEDTSFKLGVENLYLINPGSVGQPRDKVAKASFAIYYPDDHEVNIHRVEYDIKKEQDKMIAAGLPGKNSYRIEHGV